MTVKQHTPVRAHSSTSARTTNRPARPKGKAEGSKTLAAVEARAREIVADVKGFDVETRTHIRQALADHGSYLRELVRRAEKGLPTLKPQAPPDLAPGLVIPKGADAAEFKQKAVRYAQTAYEVALGYYESFHNNPFALSRLAVVYEASKPNDFHMVVTLPGSERDRAITGADLYEWLSRVEMLCRTLEHPNCSEAFRGAFGAVFTDNILDGSNVSWTTPAVVRVMLPLALMDMVRNCDGVPEQMLEILETLREQLNDDETAETVRASVVGA